MNVPSVKSTTPVALPRPTGALLTNIMGSVPEWERRITGQRTKDALE
ncbi:MAG: hypothetical protein ABI927_07975 [Gaiellaceae bacterium]